MQLAYTSGFSTSNYPLSLWPWVLVSQVVQCVTIITSCVPYLRPLLKSLSSGLYTSDEKSRRGLAETHRYGGTNNTTFGPHHLSQSTSSTKPPWPSKKKNSSVFNTSDNHAQLRPSQDTQPRSSNTPDAVDDLAPEDEITWDGESYNSQSNIIKRTDVSMTWTYRNTLE